jgi:hypothetical protein
MRRPLGHVDEKRHDATRNPRTRLFPATGYGAAGDISSEFEAALMYTALYRKNPFSQT